MYKYLKLCLVLLAVLCVTWISGRGALSAQSLITTVVVEDDVLLEDVKKLGVNLGKHDQYGASQLLKNVITNPGFEAGEFATLLFVDEGASDGTFQQDNWQVSWNSARIGQSEGFWDGAEYEVLLGETAGQQGVVERFRHDNDRYTFDVSNSGGRAFADEDLVVLRQPVAGFEGDRHQLAVADPNETRPDSPGTQSLKLLPVASGFNASHRYFMDSFWRDGDTTAGKLLVIEGNWRFEVWARGARNGDALGVTFEREGERTFFSEAFPLSTAWQKYVYEFYVPPGTDPVDTPGPNNLLALNLVIPNSAEAVWIDDIGLTRRDYTNPTVFTDKVVAALEELEPGIIRNWGNQLGSSLENQLAEPWARKTTGHSPRAATPLTWDYSLHEFLELCQLVGAEPWYVIPPTWTDDEYVSLMAYLGAPAGSNIWGNKRAELGQVAPWTEVFPEIHLEFGNELWGGNAGNDPFIGATFRGGIRVGELAGEKIGRMKESSFYEQDRFNFIIGGQFPFPERQGQIEAGSNQHDSLALSPYFGELETYENDEEIFYPLFSRPLQDVTFGKLSQSLDQMRVVRRDTDLAVYEINFHTTEGETELGIRNEFVTGVNGGLALPLYMLTYQKMLGVQNQAAFVLSQHSFRMGSGEYVRMWGLLRDMESTGLKRPTWLGLELANDAIRGDLLRTSHGGADPKYTQAPINAITGPVQLPLLQSFAYRDGDDYALLLLNLDLTEEMTVIVQSPTTPDPNALVHQLASDSIYDNNESAENVTVETIQLSDFSQSYELVLPPHSLSMIEWGKAGEAPQIVEVSPTSTPAPLPTSTPDPSIPQYVPTIRIVQNTIDAPTAIASGPTPTPIRNVIGGENAVLATPIASGDGEDGSAIGWPLYALGAAGLMALSFGLGYALLSMREKRPDPIVIRPKSHLPPPTERSSIEEDDFFVEIDLDDDDPSEF